MVRIVLAQEFAFVRATEVTLTRKVVTCDGMLTHTITSLRQDMPGGGNWHFVWAKADDEPKKAHAVSGINFAIIVASRKHEAPFFS
jgi:hypothetical protein